MLIPTLKGEVEHKTVARMEEIWHPPGVRFPRTVPTLFMVVLATSPRVSACSLSFTPISVGSRFKVKVSNYEGPVNGLRLKITRLEDGEQSAVTDAGGAAEFHTPPGMWFLEADHDNGFGLQLDVRANGPANVVVPMRWPGVEPIHVRSLAGTMRAPDAMLGQTEQAVLSLELLEGVSGRVLSGINTSGRGEFDFGKQKQGLYFIRLKPYTAFRQLMVGGLIGIAVDPAAPPRADKLDLNLTWTSCGLMYTDQGQCPYPNLHVNKLAGHVTDSIGRPVVGAEISLLDETQKRVAQVSTDPSGEFSAPDLLVGTFQLRVEAKTFTPVHTLLNIEPAARSSSLEIKAESLVCSTVRKK